MRFFFSPQSGDGEKQNDKNKKAAAPQGEINMKTITLRELQKMGCMTYSVKDDSVRGIKTIDVSDVKVGDELVLDNRFVKVIEDKKNENI